MIEGIDDLLGYQFGIENHFDESNVMDSEYSTFGGYESRFSIKDFDPHLGDPDGSGHIAQSTAFTCAVVSQQMILNDFGILNPDTGEPFSEAQLVYDATIHGWLNEGTHPDDMGNLLEYHGVPCHKGSGLENMIKELARGRKIIVGVDANELWNQDNKLLNDFQDAFIGESANHAIVVKGIKHDEYGAPVIVVNDPGMPDGAGVEYSLDVFHDAFKDSGCYYVATNNAPPGLVDDLVFGTNYDAQSSLYIGSETWLNVDLKDEPEETLSKRSDEIAVTRTIGMLSEQERKKIMLSI
jgi:hypothetical protein